MELLLQSSKERLTPSGGQLISLVPMRSSYWRIYRATVRSRRVTHCVICAVHIRSDRPHNAITCSSTCARLQKLIRDRKRYGAVPVADYCVVCYVPLVGVHGARKTCSLACRAVRNEELRRQLKERDPESYNKAARERVRKYRETEKGKANRKHQELRRVGDPCKLERQRRYRTANRDVINERRRNRDRANTALVRAFLAVIGENDE